MSVAAPEAFRVAADEDIVLVRQRVRKLCQESGFSLVEQTKVVTAASEIARNTVEYGGGGIVRMTLLNEGIRRGIRIEFEDRGPGIADVEEALRDGFTSGGGLGLGLGGAKRLVSELTIDSTPGEGTRVVLVRWK